MQELINEIKKKDRNAITQLYNRYGRKLYGYAVSKWRLQEDEAWELVYKTLYKIIEVIDRYNFESEQKFAGFIFQSYVNNLRNHYQEKKKKQLPVAELQESHIGVWEAEEPGLAAESRSRHMSCLQKALEGMEDWKKILLLMRAQDFAYEEIAKYVEKPATQLKVYYLRLKKLLITKVNECVNNS